MRQTIGLQRWWESVLVRHLPAGPRSHLDYIGCLCNEPFIPLPVPTKIALVSYVQRTFKYPALVETGTFRGDMPHGTKDLFETIHTIELGPEFASRAAKLFAMAPHITVHKGDSSLVLRQLLPTITTPCVFWLDAHYSGGSTSRGQTDTPVLGELAAIADHAVRPHVILIDDARVFGTDDAFPTLELVFARLRDIDASFQIGVAADVIWAAPTKLFHFSWQVLPSGAVVESMTAPSDPSIPAIGRIPMAGISP
jgi:hypothetical protein